MNVTDIDQVLALLTVAAMVLGGLVWIIRAQVAQTAQLKPNGGTSLVDAVARVEKQLAATDSRLADVERYLREHSAQLTDQIGAVHTRVNDHIEHHMKGNP